MVESDSTLVPLSYYRVCTGLYSPVHGFAQLAKRLSVGGFRLDLGEPLASQLTDFCDKKFRKKTDVIREALTEYFDRWAEEQELEKEQ